MLCEVEAEAHQLRHSCLEDKMSSVCFQFFKQLSTWTNPWCWTSSDPFIAQPRKGVFFLFVFLKPELLNLFDENDD